MEKEPVNSADFDDDLKSLDDILEDLEQELIADFFYTWRWFLSSQDSATVERSSVLDIDSPLITSEPVIPGSTLRRKTIGRSNLSTGRCWPASKQRRRRNSLDVRDKLKANADVAEVHYWKIYGSL